jgi:hypothetical protein
LETSSKLDSAHGAMVYKYYPITGIAAGKGPNGEVPQRQEIDAWSSKPENRTQVVLFLKALKRLQEVPPENRDSFFQIAGMFSSIRAHTDPGD